MKSSQPSENASGLARSRWADEEPELGSTSGTTLSPLAPAYAPNAGEGQGGPATAVAKHPMSGQQRDASRKAARPEELRKRQFAGKKYGLGSSHRGGSMPSTSPAPVVASSSALLPLSSSPAAKRAARAGEPLEYGAGPIEGRFGPKRVANDGEEDDGAGPVGGKGHKKQRGNDHDDLDGDETPRAGSPAPKPVETQAPPARPFKLVIKASLKVRGDGNLVCLYRTPDETNRVLMAAGARVAGIEGGQSSTNADGMLRDIRMNLDASIDVRGSGNYIGHPKAILAVAKILDLAEQQPEDETEAAVAAEEAEDQQQDGGDEDAVEGAKHGNEGDDLTLVRAEEAESHEG
ncbi:unnamed protein product [Parascedosporium putredinis]|uniref:Uncharacterized protein n=1 Tax=Parascedosporium putredinis TaxID=1442378 RepID=A0A9P1H0L4_9PEZI|nr:unnamed protein product [Parascedosporium putredinis]CAI7992826.1 unnamed protein product [Parascedosporium putredinis]